MISEGYKNKLQRLSGLITDGVLHEDNRIEYLKKYYHDELQKRYSDSHIGGSFHKRKNPNEEAEEELNNFNAIIAADPMPNKQFSKWIINLIINEKMPMEDLYKATEYLTLFEKVKQRLPIELRDINKYKSLPDLYETIAPYEKQEVVSNTEMAKMKKLEGATRVYESPKWTVISPKNPEAACLYGKETKWCTASVNNNMFQHYAKNGPLYILIDKSMADSALKNPMKKLQFHFESNQFMDARDARINVTQFFKNNRELYDLFKKLGEISPAFDLEHKLIGKEHALPILENPMERNKLINKFGVKWVIDYYQELKATKELEKLLSTDDNFITYVTKSGKLEDLYDTISKSLNTFYSKGHPANFILNNLAHLLYSSPGVREYIQSANANDKDLEKFLETLYKLGEKGKEYASELSIKTDFLYNIYKKKGKLSSFYNLIPNTKIFGSEGAKYALAKMSSLKYKKEFIAQAGTKVYEVMKDFISNIVEAGF